MRCAVLSLAALSIALMPMALQPAGLSAQAAAPPAPVSAVPRPSSPAPSSGQAPSGSSSPAPAPAAPLPPAAARPPETYPDFSGTWTLDTSISNDPSKAGFEPSQGGGNQRYGGFGGGGRGRGRGGFGGAPPRQTSGGTTDDRTPEERARLQALTDQLRKALRTIVISHHEPSFVVNDALDHTQFLTTDDKPADQQIGAQTISAATHWEGTHLVTEYTLSDRHKLVFTYTLLAETKQMVLRVRLDDTERRRVVGQEVKLAYALAPPSTR